MMTPSNFPPSGFEGETIWRIKKIETLKEAD
jgi:hypothetical protein